MYKFRVGRYISNRAFKSAEEARNAAIQWVNNFISCAIPVNAIKVFKV